MALQNVTTLKTHDSNHLDYRTGFEYVWNRYMFSTLTYGWEHWSALCIGSNDGGFAKILNYSIGHIYIRYGTQ